MAGNSKSLTLIIAALLMGCLFFINEARPLNSAKLECVGNMAANNFFDGLFIEAIKNGGPSSGGRGHKATVAEIVEENKTGGPSSGGRGHETITDEMLEENKGSGPSDGRGH